MLKFWAKSVILSQSPSKCIAETGIAREPLERPLCTVVTSLVETISPHNKTAENGGVKGVKQEFRHSDGYLNRSNWPFGCRSAWAQPSRARFYPCTWGSVPYIRHAYSAFWQNDFQTRPIGCRGVLRDKRRGKIPFSTLYHLIIKYVTFSILYKS